MPPETIEQKIEKFFEEPSTLEAPANFSRLHLCKRHIAICVGLNPYEYNQKYQSVWPAAMATLAGIDLLSLYYSGADKNSGGTFRKFCEEVMSLTPDESLTLYMLRNALMHTYGLFAVCERSPKIGVEFWFKVTIGDNSYFINMTKDETTKIHYDVSFSSLFEKFYKSIDKYHQILLTTSETEKRSNFEKIFDRIGLIGPA
ncbi:MAG: hypothetical protein Q8T08_00820 [Ignavibacteria bacterium]|nr:hypothetical protein [Ignavibacteria bacterium]